MNQDNKKSSALDRKVESYPNPKYHTLIVNYARVKEVSKSEVMCDALRLFFDSMPQHVINDILKGDIPKREFPKLP